MVESGWSGGNESTITMDGERLSRGLPENAREAQLELGKGWSGWGQAGYQQRSNGYRDVNDQIGVRLNWQATGVMIQMTGRASTRRF